MSPISKTQLDEILKIVEQIKFEDVFEAMKIFNTNGIASDEQMPYTRVVYENAEKELCQKLTTLGFSCEPKIAGKYIRNQGNRYAVYNPDIYNVIEALEWLENT